MLKRVLSTGSRATSGNVDTSSYSERNIAVIVTYTVHRTFLSNLDLQASCHESLRNITSAQSAVCMQTKLRGYFQIIVRQGAQIADDIRQHNAACTTAVGIQPQWCHWDAADLIDGKRRLQHLFREEVQESACFSNPPLPSPHMILSPCNSISAYDIITLQQYILG